MYFFTSSSSGDSRLIVIFIGLKFSTETLHTIFSLTVSIYFTLIKFKFCYTDVTLFSARNFGLS